MSIFKSVGIIALTSLMVSLVPGCETGEKKVQQEQSPPQGGSMGGIPPESTLTKNRDTSTNANTQDTLKADTSAGTVTPQGKNGK